MNKEELKNKLFKQFIYLDNDDRQAVDYCNSCERIILQKEYGGSFACEHCGSEDINIFELEDKEEN